MTLTILAAIMAGTVPAWAEVNYDPDTKTTTIDDDIVGTSFSGGGESGSTLAITGGTTTLKKNNFYDSLGIYGGSGNNGVSGDKLEISGDGAVVSESDARLYGGISFHGNADNNQVEF